MCKDHTLFAHIGMGDQASMCRDCYAKHTGATITAQAEDAMMQAMVTAALGGHNLTGWDRFMGAKGPGQQAECRYCGQSVAVWDSGLIYSLLDDACPSSAESLP